MIWKYFVSTFHIPLFMKIMIISHSIEHINQPKQKHLCLVLVNKSQLVQEWPRPLVHTCLYLNYIKLDCVFLTTVSSMDVSNFVWVIHAYITENSTYQSETEIIDKWFFSSYFPTLYSTWKMYKPWYKV